jgi:hypothetical protein
MASPRGVGVGVAKKLGWLGVYVGVVAWLTWPLAASLGTELPHTHLICNFDQRQMIWALAYASHRLVTDPLRLFDANIYYPMPHALLYAEAGFGALPFFAPTFLATGDPTLAANVMFLGSLALTAWGLHLLLAAWTGSAGAGIVAAFTFLLTPWTLWMWVPGALNYAVLQWVPLILWLAADEHITRRGAVGLGVVLALQGATSPYVAAGVLAPVGVLALVRLGRPRLRQSGVALVGALVVAVVLSLVVYGGYAVVRWREPAMVQHTWWPGGFFREFAFPHDFFLARHRPNAIPLVMFVLIAVGGVRAMVRRRTESAPAWRQGALWTAVGMLVSLPPTLVWFGHRIELPHILLLQHTPLFDLMREPQRMAVAALFGLATLAGAAYAEVAAALPAVPRLRPAVVRLVLLTLVLLAAGFTYVDLIWPPALFGLRLLPSSYPIAPTPLPSPTLAQALARRDGAVLQIPAHGESDMETIRANAQAMFESITHWRPLVNGYGGYYPEGFRETLALAARLPDPAALAELGRRTGVASIVVRGESTSAEQRAAFEALAREGGGPGLRLVLRDGPDLLFAVTDPGDVAR